MAKTGDMKLAKTCSTCKFSFFGSAAGYGFGFGKKQGGMCLVQGDKTEVPIRPHYAPVYFADDQADLHEQLKKNVPIPTREEYIEKALRAATWRNDHERLIREVGRYYDICVAWHVYWVNNFPKARLCHRQTYCDLYKEGAPKLESYARSVAKGTRTLQGQT